VRSAIALALTAQVTRLTFVARRFRQGSSVVEQPRKHSGLVVQEKFASFCARNRRQGSSVVEQGTHKPLVGSSNLPPGISIMPWVYILRGSSGRHYIGSAVDLDARLAQHRRGHTYTTKRLGERLELVASKQVETLDEARSIERVLKAKKNPQLAIFYLQQ
jgi:predicted GIY-YIG superfamily endonuclease